jgi:hypothetical protein
MTMALDKMVKVIQLLAERTEAGKIQWEETEASGAFQAAFATYSVRLSKRPSRDRDEADDIVLQIVNDDGTVVEEVSDVDMHARMENAYRTMKAIYDVARRTALGVEQALDALIGDLEHVGE